VIDSNWTDLWLRLGRSDDAPAPGPLLNILAGAALIEAEPIPLPDADDQAGKQTVGGDQARMRSEPDPVAYRVHPGVAAAIMAVAGPGVREAADAELAAYWYAVFDWARTREGGEDSDLVVRAGLAVAPYLLRRGDWRTVSILLEHAIMRDESPGTVQAVLPSLRRIADATGRPVDVAMLARVLVGVDPGEAERLMRGAVDASAVAGDFMVASAVARDLVNLMQDAGRLAEALAEAERLPEYTRRAGFGLWTQLGDQAQRLQVLGHTGNHAEVLAEIDGLRAAMAALPTRRGPGEAVDPWNVRETILGLGRSSALATGDWARCLELNAEITASKRERDAGAHEVARSLFNDAGPLIRLGRLGEAGRLLAECQRIFEDHADTARLARVLGVRAELETALGRVPAAADLGRAALRLSYARPEPRDIAIGHYNLANYLWLLGDNGAGQRAHRLAAALITRLVGMAHDLADTVRALAQELRADGGDTDLPSTVAQVVAVAEQTEGVHLGGLLAALQPDASIVDGAVAQILAAAAALPPDDDQTDIPRYLQEWEPVIAVVAAACQPGQEAPPDLLEFLDERAGTPDWAALAAVLRRILAGERDESLLGGLDHIDTAIAQETLARLAKPGLPSP
jgi:tetratricopeptide (TPR) repeat protein